MHNRLGSNRCSGNAHRAEVDEAGLHDTLNKIGSIPFNEDADLLSAQFTRLILILTPACRTYSQCALSCTKHTVGFAPPHLSLPLTDTMSNPPQEVTSDALLQADCSEGSLRSRPVRRSSLHAAAMHIGPSNLHAAKTTLHLAQELTSDALIESLQSKRAACSLRSKPVRRSSLHAAAMHIGPSNLHAAATTRPTEEVTAPASLEVSPRIGMSTGSWRSKPSVQSSTEDIETTLQPHVDIPSPNTSDRS